MTAEAAWDPDILARVRHLHLRARTLTDALLMGEHRSRRVGQAVEFADYQAYQPGLDLRGLDWRVWGRTDKYVVKRFETETELPCTVILDMSGDLSTGKMSSTKPLPDLEGSKAGYAICLAATLLFFLHRHGEPVGLEIVAGEGMNFRVLPPRTGRNHLQLCFMMLASVRPSGVADLLPSLSRIGNRIRRRSFVALITDGMEEPENWLPALAALARRKTDFRMFHLHDPAEWALEFRQPALFYSPEGGAPISVDPQGAREAFAEVVAEYKAEVRSGVVRWGGRYIPVRTDRPLEEVLRAAILDAREGAWA